MLRQINSDGSNMTLNTSFQALAVETGDNPRPLNSVSREIVKLEDRQVLIQINYSSLNYKDALAATGHPGVALSSPLVPGIDAVGSVVDSNSPEFSAGDNVIVAHEDFGTRQDGGWAEYAGVPESWLVKLPESMSAKQAMVLGTAGFTAAQSVEALLNHQIEPDSGPIVVTGATGGVGIVSLCLLSKLGYEVIAVSGKQEHSATLEKLGASQVLSREQMVDDSKSPLLKGMCAGAVDSVGGQMLTTILRSTRRGGCVTACGLVGGANIAMTVYPFILRGVTLQGIDSAGVSQPVRQRIWNKLAGEWQLDLAEISSVIPFDEVGQAVQTILQGKIFGRTVIQVKA